MAPRTKTAKLELLGPLTTHFKRRSGKVSHYREFLFFDDGQRSVAGYEDAHVTRPFRVNGELLFDKAFKAFRVQEVGDTFTTIAVYLPDDTFLGYYSDATMPWKGNRRAGRGKFETDIDDLYLDHFIFADGRGFVMDYGELNEGLLAGTISPPEAELSMATISWLHEMHGEGDYPRERLAGLRLDPGLLSQLPASQE